MWLVIITTYTVQTSNYSISRLMYSCWLCTQGFIHGDNKMLSFLIMIADRRIRKLSFWGFQNGMTLENWSIGSKVTYFWQISLESINYGLKLCFNWLKSIEMNQMCYPFLCNDHMAWWSWFYINVIYIFSYSRSIKRGGPDHTPSLPNS